MKIIDTAGATIVAEATTGGGDYSRWTELVVFHRPGEAKCWLGEVRACSSREGEVTRRTQIASASLDRAMKLIDDSDTGIVVKEMAREYAEDHNIPTRAVPDPRYIPKGEREALAWLYGVDSPDMLSLNAAAADLDAGESTMRAALAAGRPIKVPLRALLPFVDVKAFRDAVAQKRETARG